jgi:hypothetical protein
MAVTAVDLVLPQGTDFEQNFTLFNDDGNRLPLVGYAITSKLRKHYGATGVTTFTSSILDESLGVIRISLNKEQTSSLKPGRHYFDILVTSSSNITTKVVEGMIIVEGTASV